MNLPVKYKDIPFAQRRVVREEYTRVQNGLCYHCKAPLDGPSSDRRKVNMSLFPPNFFKWPVHLHHSHDTGMTLGAVHCHCNAILWQYYGE